MVLESGVGMERGERLGNPERLEERGICGGSHSVCGRRVCALRSCLLVSTHRYEACIPPAKPQSTPGDLPSLLLTKFCEIIPNFLVLCSLQTKTHNFSKLGQIWDIHDYWKLSPLGRFGHSPSINSLRFSEPENFPDSIPANGWSLRALATWTHWVSADAKDGAERKGNAF